MLQVFEILLYFVDHGSLDVRLYALKAIGASCVRYGDYMLNAQMTELYHRLLTQETDEESMRIQVVQNIETYLREEDANMAASEQNCKCYYWHKHATIIGPISSPSSEKGLPPKT